jgi:hypothetical protein
MEITIGLTITTEILTRISMGVTVRIVIEGRIRTGIIFIRIKMQITIKIIQFTITVSKTIQRTMLKRTMPSGLTVVGKQDRQTHRQTHMLFFTHTTA